MWLSLILFVLLVAILLFQARQGMFSALLMMVLTICSASVALCSYEWVSTNWVASLWKPSLAAALSLTLLFVVPLVVLRLVSDKVITRMCVLPVWFDRVGAGVCGLVTAMVSVGVMAVALQLLPFHYGSVLGFKRVDAQPYKKLPDGPDPKPPVDAQNELWLKPDRFAIATASHLSNGLFSGKTSFSDYHPDLLESIGWLNAAPAVAQRFAPPKSIEVVRTQPLQVVYRLEPERKNTPAKFETIEPAAGYEYWMVRVQLKKAARAGEKSHTFSLRQFRLVGQRDGRSSRAQFYPIAIQQQKDDSPNRHVKLFMNGKYGDWPVTERAYEPRVGNEGQVEVVYEVPDDFNPEFIEYKRGARAEVSFSDDKSAGSGGGDEPSGATASGQTAGSDSAAGSAGRTRGSGSSSQTASSNNSRSGRRQRGGRGGNIRGVTSSGRGSFFGDSIPMALTAYNQRSSSDISRGKLVDGHLVSFVDEQASGTNPKVNKLEVPSDKRLLHLNTDKLTSRSGIGRLISSTVNTLQNFFVEDDRGGRHKVVGKYAEADVNGRRVFEIQYFSNPTGSVGGMGKFDKIKDADLKGDYQLVFLFLVDPGVKIVRFSTGGSATRADDLSGENLVAPN
ncbi:MAG: hypothetical protein ACYTHJ_02655 [Planctomycetota bacterium]|jgi:hypothetical protein